MDYRQLQGELRRQILALHFQANSGHIGCSLSCIDLLIAIFETKQKGDDFILSKGHAATAIYTMLHHIGEISSEELTTFYKNNTRLPAHPAPLQWQSIPFATGSLGHGFSIATGIAKANKLAGGNAISSVLMSDGETNEGTTWEAAHFAVAHGLDNLIVYIDKNGLQGFGNTADVLGDTAQPAIWQSIGFDVVTVNGHSIEELIEARQELLLHKNGKPKLIIAQTVKGKGVLCMENKLEWHYLPMSPEQYETALNDLATNYYTAK